MNQYIITTVETVRRRYLVNAPDIAAATHVVNAGASSVIDEESLKIDVEDVRDTMGELHAVSNS